MALNPTPKQVEAIEAIRQGYRYILTGGAISTAKSYGMASIFLSLALQFPKTRYGLGRRNMTTIKRTLYQTFKKVAEDMGVTDYRENRQEMYWQFPNGSQIWFIELDHTKDPDFNKIKGLELTAGGIDEVNEVTEDAFRIFSSRVGRENRNNEPQFVLASCNPTDNWVKDVWYTPHVAGKLKKPYIFIPSLPTDNPHNSKEYLEALNDMPDAFRKRYVEGDWDYVDEEGSLFPNRLLDKADTDTVPKEGDRWMGVDPKREGGDRFTAVLIEGDTVVDSREISITFDSKTPISHVYGEKVIGLMNEWHVGADNVWVDAVGNGGAIVDYCRSKEYYVNEYKAGSRPNEAYEDGTAKYDMARSEGYYLCHLAMDSGELKLYSGLPDYADLRKDLLMHTYEVDNKVIKVESKEKIKKRLQKSPDFSDAMMMAWWGKNKPQTSYSAWTI